MTGGKGGIPSLTVLPGTDTTEPAAVLVAANLKASQFWKAI